MAYKIKSKKIPYRKYEERVAYINGFYDGKKAERREIKNKWSYRLK